MPASTNSSAQPQGEPQPGSQGVEKSDLAVKGIFVFFLLLLVSGVAIHFIIAAQLDTLRKKPSQTDAWGAGARTMQAQATKTPRREFPRLQLSPPADLQAFRAREEAELSSYGWVSKTAGVARIPIERAMKLLLQNGLPVRSGTNHSQPGVSSLQLQQQRPLQMDPERKLEK